MIFKSSLIGALIAGVSFVVSIPAVAHPARIFGSPEPSHVRPPLWVNPDAGESPTSINNNVAAPYTPQQVQLAYGFNQIYTAGTTGSGQTIAIVDAYDDSANIQNDLNTFDSQFELPAATVKIIYAQGSKPVANTGWQQEESLDVEWAHAIAPGAKILLVEAADSSTTSLLQAVQVAISNGATVVSMSWGGGEFSGESSYDSYFSAPGVTFVASAGDSGTGVEWPAASPNVVGVGGTSLVLNSAGGYGSETAWSDSGGGISAYESQPIWQNHWFQTAWTPVNRGVPDVGYLADPNYGVYVAYQGQWYEFGGTSVGAPQWSALIALANQRRTSALSGTDKAVYSLANGGGTTSSGGYTLNAVYFHDVTLGSDGSAPDDSAFVGYDLVTGVGSPVASNLVPALTAWGSAPPPPAPDFALAVSPSSQTVAAGVAASYTITVTGSNGYSGTVDFSAAGLPAGASETFVPTFIVGSGSATLNVGTSSSTPVGTRALTITGTDATGSPKHTINASLVVTKPATNMTVNGLNYSVGGPNHANLNIAIRVDNNRNDAVTNASVSITVNLNGSPYASGTAATGSNGWVTFTLDNAPLGTYNTIVTSVTASGLPWDGHYLPNSYYDAY